MVSLIAQTRKHPDRTLGGLSWNQSSSRSMYKRGFSETRKRQSGSHSEAAAGHGGSRFNIVIISNLPVERKSTLFYTWIPDMRNPGIDSS